jgi:hypothetical protein
LSLDDPALPPDWTGGDKRVCSCVSVGAFNGLDLAGFLAHLRSISGDSPGKVQVLVWARNTSDSACSTAWKMRGNDTLHRLLHDRHAADSTASLSRTLSRAS